ncbi:helix-turn-helix transcriptional regulator [Selenomonas noxia]|jgi:transcriptional regulator with XRE-family HTH domain|uniref:helix-turn-helix domain-containing protein n=1 Tax=Selenomonas noxia TaxID=135083 RepID=UPI0028D13D7F|nr:helix-turn-helix transcriptional regulator [Selenomonas noxia]
MMNTGKRLRELREAKGLSQEEVAKAIGVGRVTYLKYENGENRPVRKLKELSSFFKVSIDYLLGNSDSLTTPTGQKIDARTRRQLEKVLEDDELTYNGVVLNAEDKERVRKALELAFWDIKEMNKRKK